MKGDFLPNSIAEGFCFSEFADDWEKIQPRFRKDLIKLIARISEASYRRGFQHGATMTHDGRFTFDERWLHRFRFETSLNKAPDPQAAPKILCGVCGTPKTSIGRLAIEYERSLSNLGLSVPDKEVEAHGTL